MLHLTQVKWTHPRIRLDMLGHYSQPGGFVGRNIAYTIQYGWDYYGSIVGGSSPMHLPGRDDFYKDAVYLNHICNNLFFHIEKRNNSYPMRNFAPTILAAFRERVAQDWINFYGERIVAFESLVELPRLGECYKRDGWKEVGITKGFTCKRTAGHGTDSYGGKRVWNKINLRPKRVFIRYV